MCLFDNPGDAISLIRMLVAEQINKTHTMSGYVKSGSYNATNNTISVNIGNTMALGDTAVEQPLILDDIPIMSHGIGIQSAPVGGECVNLIKTDAGWAAHFQHYDDLMQPPQQSIQPGEHFMHLRSTNADLVAATFLRIQQDASRLGHQNQVSLIAPVVALGSDSASGTSDNAIVRQSDLQAALESQRQNTFQAIQTTAMRCQPGNGVAAAQIATTTASGSTTSFTL